MVRDKYIVQGIWAKLFSSRVSLVINLLLLIYSMTIMF